MLGFRCSPLSIAPTRNLSYENVSFSADKIFGSKSDFRKFCPPKFCPIIINNFPLRGLFDINNVPIRISIRCYFKSHIMVLKKATTVTSFNYILV